MYRRCQTALGRRYVHYRGHQRSCRGGYRSTGVVRQVGQEAACMTCGGFWQLMGAALRLKAAAATIPDSTRSMRPRLLGEPVNTPTRYGGLATVPTYLPASSKQHSSKAASSQQAEAVRSVLCTDPCPVGTAAYVDGPVCTYQAAGSYQQETSHHRLPVLQLTCFFLQALETPTSPFS